MVAGFLAFGENMAFQPCDIRDVWSVVRKGLEIVKESTDQQWIPEDVYSACVNKRAFLYMDRDRTPDGFAIFQSQYCEFERISKFLIWIVYDPVNGTALNYVDDWENLARDTGHDAVEFVTPLEGVGRLTKKLGYNKVSSLYRKDI